MCHLLIHDHEYVLSVSGSEKIAHSLIWSETCQILHWEAFMQYRCFSFRETQHIRWNSNNKFHGRVIIGRTTGIRDARVCTCPVGLLRTPNPGQPKHISFLFLLQINWRCNREFNSWIKYLISWKTTGKHFVHKTSQWAIISAEIVAHLDVKEHTVVCISCLCGAHPSEIYTSTLPRVSSLKILALLW